MVELTESVPKPMLDVGGKPLLEYKFEALPESIDEVIIVVGYLKEVIKRHFGSHFGGRAVRYVDQRDDLDGTAGALWSAKELLHDRFLVMMGDDIYTPEDIEACIAEGDVWRLVVQEIAEMHRAGNVEIGPEGDIVDIIEGDRDRERGLASTNMFLLDTRVFDATLVPKQSGSLEYGLPQTVVIAAREMGIRFEPVYTDQWIQITAPKDLVYAAEALAERKKKEEEAKKKHV